MKRIDRVKLLFTRNWNLPGRERFSHWLKPKGQPKYLNKGITWLNNEDIAIHTTADNFIEWAILSTGTYEDDIGKLITISLNEGDVALDIGANIGLQSLRMSRGVGASGKIYAFEPIEYLQAKFKRNITLNKTTNVVLMPFALADNESVADFNIDRNTWNQGTFSLNNKGSGNETQKVIIKVADNIDEIKLLDKLALIKIDVEGFEYQVLKGLVTVLEKHKPRIIFEYDKNYWANTGGNITECYNFLVSLNYMIYQVNSVGCELAENPESIEDGNLFCMQNE